MKTVTIVLNPDEILVLNSALYEFVSRRETPSVEAYVSKRYDYLTGEAKAKKIEEVKKRIEIAETIRNVMNASTW